LTLAASRWDQWLSQIVRHRRERVGVARPRKQAALDRELERHPKELMKDLMAAIVAGGRDTLSQSCFDARQIRPFRSSAEARHAA